MRGAEHATLGIIIFALLLVLPVFWYIRQARKGRDLYVRKIPGIQGIEEATGRAAELGRPMVFCPGITGLGPVLYACLGVLFYIARKAAVYKSKLLMPQNGPDVMAVTEDVARDAYRAEGKISAFDPASVMYLSDEQFAFAAGYMGLVQREKVAAAFLFGSFAAESLMLAEAGQQVGAMQVAATVSPEQVAFFICTCDYTLIGEELYAASAYLTREPVQLGSLYGQDIAKMFCFILILLGVVFSTWNACNPSQEIPKITNWLVMEYW